MFYRPRIESCSGVLIVGNYCTLREYRVRDFFFTFRLRRDKALNRFIHKTTLLTHIKFFLSLKRLDEYNFVVQDKSQRRIGSIAVYSINREKGTAELGRWVCIGTPVEKIESLHLALKISFEIAGLTKVYCHTRMSNSKVIKLHQRLPYSEKTQIQLESRDYLCTSLDYQDWKAFDNYVGRYAARRGN